METNKLVIKEYLGTGKIAKLFNVAPRTVAKWIDNDILHGTRIPGSKHRRVAMTEVVRFANEHDMPLTKQDEIPQAPEALLADGQEQEILLPAPIEGFDPLLGRKEV